MANDSKRYNVTIGVRVHHSRSMNTSHEWHAPDKWAKSIDKGRSHRFWENGAGEAIRTPDPNLGKVVLYP